MSELRLSYLIPKALKNRPLSIEMSGRIQSECPDAFKRTHSVTKTLLLGPGQFGVILSLKMGGSFRARGLDQSLTNELPQGLSVHGQHFLYRIAAPACDLVIGLTGEFTR